MPETVLYSSLRLLLGELFADLFADRVSSIKVSSSCSSCAIAPTYSDWLLAEKEEASILIISFENQKSLQSVRIDSDYLCLFT